MKRNRLFPAICLVAALLLSACSQNELAENSTTLPEGEYPLQIGSVSLTAEVSEQPWTRVAESTDGMSSVWKDGDKIGVRIGDNEETGIYVVDVDIEGSVVGVTPEKPVYWKDKQPAIITAWYPVKEELDFTHQNQGLTYLLKATGNGDYQSTPINLNFTHQLAKVRVELTGTKSNEVQQVYVRSYPTSTHSHGTLDGQDKSLTPQYVPMRRATYGGVEYWEANLRPGYLDANNSFQVANADGVRVQVTQGRVNIEAGHVHTIKINVGEAKPVEGEISDDGYYRVNGTFDQQITVTGGNPTIYLEGASINVSDGPAINITGGNPTIHVIGANNTVSTSDGAGIYVAPGSSVTIEGNSRENDILEAHADRDGAGIGGSGWENYTNTCGDIIIRNVTVKAYGHGSMLTSPGIGSYGTCGNISIDNALVYAHGGLNDAPAIGSKVGDIPTITINASVIYAYRGGLDYLSPADWIGKGSYTANGIHGDIRNSIIHKFLYDYLYQQTIAEGAVEYDANGISKEQSQ